MAGQTSSTRLFLKAAREDFQRIGAIAPSSRFLARAVTWGIRADGGPTRVLEAGAGTGALTIEILKRMPSGSHLDIYEVNPIFARHLTQRFGGAGKVTVHNRRVQEILMQPPYDAIVSGLPLNNFKPSEVQEILATLMSALKPGGILTYFEYLMIRELKSLASGRRVKRRLKKVGLVTGSFIEKYELRREAVFLNIPPALVHHLRRPA